MIRVQRTVPLGMVLACAATFLISLATSHGPGGSAPVTDRGIAARVSVPMTQAEMSVAVGGKPAYCDKALVSCVDGCSGNWGWLGQIFVGACNTGCYYGYLQCGGA
jgi:hypothetical protein